MKGDNDFLLDQMVWSFSRLQLFNSCKYEWYLHYIEDNCEDKSSNVYAEFGSFCHEILRKYFDYELEKHELADYYDEYFDDNVTSFCFSKTDVVGNLRVAGHDYFKNINIDRDKIKIICVEQLYTSDIDKYKFKGIIDLLYQEGDDYILLDHKSARSPLTKGGKIQKSQQKKFDDYKRQLYLYSKFVKEQYGKFPKYLEWNFFRDDKIYRIEFNEDDYNESIKWAKETIEAIYDEDSFKPSTDFFYCSNLCDYRVICKYS